MPRVRAVPNLYPRPLFGPSTWLRVRTRALLTFCMASRGSGLPQTLAPSAECDFKGGMEYIRTKGTRNMTDRRNQRIEGRSVNELLASLMDAEPGSLVHEQVRAAINVRIAELGHDSASESVTWAKRAAMGTIATALIALAALLISVL